MNTCGWEKVLEGEEEPSSWSELRPLPPQGERETHKVYFLRYTKGVLGLLCAWKVLRPSAYQNQNVGPGEMAPW